MQVGATGKTLGPYGVALPAAVGYPLKNEHFALSVWVEGPPHRSILVEIAEQGGPFPTRVTTQRAFHLNGKWQRVSLVGGVQRKDRTALNIYLIRRSNIGLGESFYLDDVVLVPRR